MKLIWRVCKGAIDYPPREEHFFHQYDKALDKAKLIKTIDFEYKQSLGVDCRMEWRNLKTVEYIYIEPVFVK